MFRGESVGADTSDYITDYKDMSIMTFRDILENYKGYQGYYVLSKVFSILDLPYYVWFGFVELVLVSAIARFINKYSNDKLFSILIFITTGFFMFSLAGLKQTLAMGFVFHAYIDFVEKHYLRFLALNVLAYTIHIVALLGDLIIIFYIIRNRRVYYPIFVVLLFSILFGGMYLVSSLTKIIGNDHYGSTYLNTGHSYSGTTLYFYLFVLGCTIPFLKSYLKDNSIAKVALVGSMLVCAFQYLSSYSASLFRLAYCFMPFFIVLIPNVFSIKNPTLQQQVFGLLTIFVVIFFCLYTHRNFVFTFA